MIAVGAPNGYLYSVEFGIVSNRKTTEAVIDNEIELFNTDLPEPADAQKEQFQSLLEETLDDECSFEVVQSVHEQLRDMIEAHNADKAAEPLVISATRSPTCWRAAASPTPA